jgi:predicted metal-dependent hydrolase
MDCRGKPLKDINQLHQAGGIDYRIRISERARTIRLTLSPREGLTVVIPRGCDVGRIPAIVEKKRNWIEGHLRRFAEAAVKGGAHDSGAAGSTAVRREAAALPASLELPALGESWRISYEPANTRFVGVRQEAPGSLLVYGALEDRRACREVLRQWLRLRAREELVPWLGRLAAEHGLGFREAMVRGQRTRWASCSSKGTINLSFKLLFLERAWVRCVLLHELCHRVCMNHSARFWTILGGMEPQCRAIQKQMREAWRKVPAWVEEREGE